MESPLDQHMLVDPGIRDLLIKAAHLSPKDIVLEIGAGQGYITRELAKHCAKVYAFEQDRGFSKSMAGLPSWVEIRYGNALGNIGSVSFSKIVSNLPFSISEPFIKSLLTKEVECASLIVSKHFFDLLSPASLTESKWAVITPLFYSLEKIGDVPKEAFTPQPKIKTVLITLTRRASPFTMSEFILRQVILQDDKLVKNALTNAIKTATGCTKWQAKQGFLTLKIPNHLHRKRVDHLSNRQFKEVTRKITSARLNNPGQSLRDGSLPGEARP